MEVNTQVGRLRRQRLKQQEEAERMRRRDFTQNGVAAALGISRPSYMKLEQHPEKITVVQAKKLAAYFGVTEEEFGEILAADVEIGDGTK